MSQQKKRALVIIVLVLAALALLTWAVGAQVATSWPALPTRNPSPTGLATVTPLPTWSPTPVTFPTSVYPTGTPTLSLASPSLTPEMEQAP